MSRRQRQMCIRDSAHTPSVTEGYAATDVSGIVLSVPVSASNSATITRESSTTAGFVRVDLVWIGLTSIATYPQRMHLLARPKAEYW